MKITNYILTELSHIRSAIDDAYDRIYKFHSLQKSKNIKFGYDLRA